MGLTINTIITLENDEKYIVLNETLYKGSKYFMAMGIDDKKNLIPEKVSILKELIEGIDTYIIKIEDQDLILTITKIFEKQF